MLKVLVLQMLCNPADRPVEYQIGDRLSFIRLLGLARKTSCLTTVWRYCEAPAKAGLITKLFDRVDRHLDGQGLHRASSDAGRSGGDL
jgi:IS5 family transposase